MRKTFWAYLICWILLSCADSNSASTALLTQPSGSYVLALGDTLQLSATLETGGAKMPGVSADWTSSAPEVAQIIEVNRALPLKEGSAQLVAAYQGVVSTPIKVTVIKDGNKVVSVVISALKSVIKVNETLQFEAVAKNFDGVELSGKSPVWQSDDFDILMMNSSGLGTALGQGTVHVSATINQVKSNVLEITVVP